MKRRDVIAGLSTAVASAVWLRSGRTQQLGVPVVGFLGLPDGVPARVISAFRRGLNEAGYFEGRNVAIEFRWADGQFDRLPALAAELVRSRATVIFAYTGPAGIRAARAVSATIPIVFSMGEDPIKEGIVASLSRPDGNVTGVVNFQNQLSTKKLGLLHDTVPTAPVLAFLVNPAHPNAEAETKDTQTAAEAFGLELRVLGASAERDFEAAFAAMNRQHVGGVSVSHDPFFFARREQLIALAARYAVPSIYDRRDFPAAGGLMSYGTNDAESFRQSGVYTGRILRGEKVADLPVVQSAKFEFVINLKTAKTLGLDIPAGILAIVDEVIE